MKIHPDCGWRGIHPPPVFSRDELSDIIGHAEEKVEAAAAVNEAETGECKNSLLKIKKKMSAIRENIKIAF